MEPLAKRQRLSPPAEQRLLRESSSDDDNFYAPAPPIEQPKAHEETDYDDEVEILDEGEELEEINEADLHLRRSQSLNKIRSKWDDICAKYGREFENADEIDLNTLEVVVDNGHIAQMQDETDVGNGQPTPRREQHRMQNKGDDDGLRGAQKRRRQDTQRSPERRFHHDRRSPRRKSRSPVKSDLKHEPGAGRDAMKKAIYEDESSDDDFLYAKPALSTVVLAPRQPQAINQIRPRGGSRTVVEKRTVITTKRITTSTIRDDRSGSTGGGDENSGRHTSHERSSREVQRYTKSSQEKVVESSSDDELVQRDHEQAKVLRSPSPTGKGSLWAPRKKAGRPRIHHPDGRSERHARPGRPSPRRVKRIVRYDADGNKIRKERSDRGIPRVPEHLRKAPFRNKYAADPLASDSSMIDAPILSQNRRPRLTSARTHSSTSIQTTASKKPQQQVAKPMVFARNTIDKSYEFSDEDDDPPPVTPASLLTAASTDIFLGQNITSQPVENLEPRPEETCHSHFVDQLCSSTFEISHSRAPSYSEIGYDPAPLELFNPSTEYEHYSAPMAPMAYMPPVETLHQFIPAHGESSYMDTYTSFPSSYPRDLTQQQGHPEPQDEYKPLQTGQTIEAPQYELKIDLPIPIDPALLAFDAENRAASIERAQAASDPVDEPGMESAVVPTLPFAELTKPENHVEAEEDSDDDLFSTKAEPQSYFMEAVDEQDSDSGDDLEDFLIPAQHPSTVSETPLVDSAEDPGVVEAAAVNDTITSYVLLETVLPTATTSAVEKEGPARGAAEHTACDKAIPRDNLAPEVDRSKEDDVTVSREELQIAAAVPSKSLSPPVLLYPGRTEVPDSDAESEDELLTQPSSQAPPRPNLPGSQQSPARSTPRTAAATKRVRFADTMAEKDVTSSKVLPPPPWSPLTDEEGELQPQRSSSPSWQPKACNDPVEEALVDDDEDDLALIPASPIRRPKSIPKAVSAPPPATFKTSQPAPRCTETISGTQSLPPSRTKPAYNDEDELATPKSILKRPSRSATPQPSVTKSRSRSTSISRMTPPRLFSFSASPQPASQSKTRPKLRASLLSEAASTTSSSPR